MSRLEQLRSAFGVIHILPLEKDDAARILELAQLVVDVDGDEDTDEIQLYFEIGKLLFELAEAPDTPVPTFASHEDDEERLFEVATALKGTPTRELAFVVTRILAEADLEIIEVEDTFLDRLRGLLSITRERADELDTLWRIA